MPTKKPSPLTTPSITSERIAERAYELFIERGGHAGYHVEDWLQAERELNGAHGEAPAAEATDVPKPVRKRASASSAPKAAEKVEPPLKTEKPKTARSTSKLPKV